MTSHITGKSVLVDDSFLSQYSNSKSDRILETLRRDSEDISTALKFYLEQREELSERRKAAEREYDAEMAEIGEFSDVEEIGGEDDGFGPKGVDHNLRRHLNAAGEEGGENASETDDYYDEDFDDLDDEKPKRPGGAESMTLTGAKSSAGYQKRVVPSAEVKSDIRSKMFSFLDESRVEEYEIEQSINELKATFSQNSNPTDVEQIAFERKMFGLTESLFRMQKFNFDKLTDFITDYQPASSGKLWGNDPDYRSTMKELKSRLHIK